LLPPLPPARPGGLREGPGFGRRDRPSIAAARSTPIVEFPLSRKPARWGYGKPPFSDSRCQTARGLVGLVDTRESGRKPIGSIPAMGFARCAGFNPSYKLPRSRDALRPGFATSPFATPRGGGAPRDAGYHDAVPRRARDAARQALARRLASPAGDARLSALHRGDFWPRPVPPSPSFPPDPCSELLAAGS